MTLFGDEARAHLLPDEPDDHPGWDIVILSVEEREVKGLSYYFFETEATHHCTGWKEPLSINPRVGMPLHEENAGLLGIPGAIFHLLIVGKAEAQVEDFLRGLIRLVEESREEK